MVISFSGMNWNQAPKRSALFFCQDTVIGNEKILFKLDIGAATAQVCLLLLLLLLHFLQHHSSYIDLLFKGQVMLCYICEGKEANFKCHMCGKWFHLRCLGVEGFDERHLCYHCDLSRGSALPSTSGIPPLICFE